jgi:hypothetical protein
MKKENIRFAGFDGLKNKQKEVALPIAKMAEFVVRTAIVVAYAPIKAAENLTRRKR